MYFHDHNHHKRGLSKFYNRPSSNKNKFGNIQINDLSSIMMAVYPDGVVGIISISQLSPSLSQSTNNYSSIEIQQELKATLNEEFIQLTSINSSSELSIKSAPAEYSLNQETNVNESGIFWKPGDECLAPYINGDVSIKLYINFLIIFEINYKGFFMPKKNEKRLFALV